MVWSKSMGWRSKLVLKICSTRIFAGWLHITMSKTKRKQLYDPLRLIKCYQRRPIFVENHKLTLAGRLIGLPAWDIEISQVFSSNHIVLALNVKNSSLISCKDFHVQNLIVQETRFELAKAQVNRSVSPIKVQN